ncbi:reverse transcriptase domain-containing protein [Tanacetum coccineum]
MADNRTMAQLLEAPTEGYEDAIVIPEITANNFEIKHGLLNLVQNKQFFGNDKEDPHAHIRYFNKITSTMKIPNVPNTSVNTLCFSVFLEGLPDYGWRKKPPRSTETGMILFQQKFDETFYEAWDRFNDLLRGCPHHGFSELHQLDTFYNALNSIDQDSLNSAAGAVSSDVAELKDMVRALILDRKNQTPASAPVKAVEQSCVTCGGVLGNSSGTLLQPKGRFKRSRCLLANNGSTKDVQPPVVQIQSRNLNPEPNVSPVVAPVVTPIPKALIPFPSRRNDERRKEKANDQIEKFYEIFRDLKDCSAVNLHTRYQRKLGDPGRCLIPCDLRGLLMQSMADLGASINLMPYSVWNNLSLPELTPTCMTLELADRSITKPIGIAEDVFVNVGKFQFPADFVVVDFEPDPRVPLILGRCFLKTSHALIDVLCR